MWYVLFFLNSSVNKWSKLRQKSLSFTLHIRFFEMRLLSSLDVLSSLHITWAPACGLFVCVTVIAFLLKGLHLSSTLRHFGHRSGKRSHWWWAAPSWSQITADLIHCTRSKMNLKIKEELENRQFCLFSLHVMCHTYELEMGIKSQKERDYIYMCWVSQ